MVGRTLGLLIAATLVVAGCATEGGDEPPDPDAPILQIRSEGGFAPIEWILGRGPTYTLLADGRLISEGPVVAIYPGPLLPNYLVSQVGDEDMDRILALVDDIGLAGMTREVDNSAADTIADATTEVVTFWDEKGTHQYGVYALGIEPDSEKPSTAALAELLVVLDTARTRAEAVPFESDRVRILAGVAMSVPDPEFEDVRPWPLGDDDPADWEEVPPGWACEVYGPEVLDALADATQATRWLHPNPMMDAPAFALLVRPLHPGEGDCQIPSP